MTDALFDLSELQRLGREFMAVDPREDLRKVVAKGALNVKTSMRAEMSRSAHFGQVARSITYETRETARFTEAQVGPVTGGKVLGDLAHIAYFGGAQGGGGTVRDPQVDADEEAPRMESAIASLIDGWFR